jgi:hypothetical protein
MSTTMSNKLQKVSKSGEKNKKPEESSSVGNMFQILLQSRSSSQQSYPDKISMTSKDMKLLGVKAGCSVLLQSGSIDIICKAWPSKTLTAGSASIHRLGSESGLSRGS